MTGNLQIIKEFLKPEKGSTLEYMLDGIIEEAEQIEKQNQLLKKFSTEIAKLEPGCAPSVGYMGELIGKANKALNPSS